MFKKLLTISLICLAVNVIAQTENRVDPVPVASYTNPYSFDKSWQYLKTEVYPVNFKCLTNAFLKGGLLKSRSYKDISMTMKVEGVDCDDLEFLVYNFKRPSSLRKLNLSEVTLFNGVPVYDAPNIDAVIHFNTVNNKNKFVYTYAANQLKDINLIDNKNIALALSKEMGALIESENKSENYTFSSPITICKNDDGKYKLYSYSIYMLSSQAHNDSVFTDSLMQSFVVKDRFQSGAIQKFARKDTAYIFVVNYLAQYRSDITSLKDYSNEEVEARFDALKNLGVSPDIIDYEKTLTEYLDRYATLHNDVDEAENSSDNSKLLRVLKDYYRLNVKYNLVLEQMEDDSVMKAIFFKNYKTIHDKADNELLKGSDEFLYVKNVSDYLLDRKDYTDYKKSLKIFSKYEFSDKDDKIVRKIATMRQEAEQLCYDDNFQHDIDRIYSSKLDARSSIVTDLQKLKLQYKDCQYCVQETDKAIAFGQDKMKSDTAKNALASARRISDSFMVDILTKEDSLKEVFDGYPLENRPEIIKYQETKFTALQSRRKVLQNRINKDYASMSNADLIDISDELTAEAKSINDDLDALIETVKPYKEKAEKVKTIAKSDVKSAIRQAKKSVATFEGYSKNPDYEDIIAKKFSSASAYCQQLKDLMAEDYSSMSQEELEAYYKDLNYNRERLDSEISEIEER